MAAMQDKLTISYLYCIVRIADKEKTFPDKVALRGQSWDGFGAWAQAVML
ncbi:MAG: hypothetical protein OXG53_12390 [Chloroflexi bacterium]|nr:hypothetical protein [Chloroflexota bacterium]